MGNPVPIYLAMTIIQIKNEILDLCNRSLIVKGRKPPENVTIEVIGE